MENRKRNILFSEEQIQEKVGLLSKEMQSDNLENFKEKRFILVDNKEIILPIATLQ